MLHQRTRPLPDAEPFLHTSHVADLLHALPQDHRPLGQGAACPTSAPSVATAATPSQAIRQLAASLAQGVRAS